MTLLSQQAINEAIDNNSLNDLIATMIDSWKPTLEAEFGHNKFWQLSKPYKRQVYARIAQFIADDIRMIAEIETERVIKGQKSNVENSK
jgi:hypothetical protein